MINSVRDSGGGAKGSNELFFLPQAVQRKTSIGPQHLTGGVYMSRDWVEHDIPIVPTNLGSKLTYYSEGIDIQPPVVDEPQQLHVDHYLRSQENEEDRVKPSESVAKVKSSSATGPWRSPGQVRGHLFCECWLC